MKELAKAEGSKYRRGVKLTSLDIQRKRYCKSTFNVDPALVPDFCSKVAQEYAKGLCWVLTYYYQVRQLGQR